MKRKSLTAWALALGASLIGIVVPMQANATVQYENVFRANNIYAGAEHICFVSQSAYHCAGENSDGQLGSGDNTDLNYGKEIREANNGMLFANVFYTTVGANHSCFITSSNASVASGVYCWGDNAYGQLGDGTTTDRNVPTRVADNQASGFVNTGVNYIVAGYNHTCAVKADQIFCWGRNDQGQLGNGSTTDSSLAVKPGSPFATGNASQAITLGESHSCATEFSTSPRTVYCWGDNFYGQLGNGTNTDSSTPVATNISGASGASEAQFISSLASTADSTCMAGNSGFGNVYCWGRNDAGQLGDGTRTAKNVPTLVSANGTFANNYTQGANTSAYRTLGAGGKTVCARTVAGSTPNRYLHCWGENGGKIAGSANADEILPVAIPSNSASSFNPADDHSSFDAIAVSKSSPAGFACFAKWCWGENTKGQLAQGDTNYAPLPVVIKTGRTQSSGGGGSGGGGGGGGPTPATLTSATITKKSGLKLLVSVEGLASGARINATIYPTGWTYTPGSGGVYMAFSGAVDSSTLEVTGLLRIAPPNVTPDRLPFAAGVDYTIEIAQRVSGPPSQPITKTFTFTGNEGAEASSAATDSTTTTAVAANVFASAVPGVTKTDTKVYTQAPPQVAADSAINVLSTAQNKVMDIQTKTPAVCLPNDDELIFIDEGRCIAEVVNAKTRAVLRTLRTTVVEDEVSELKVGNAIVTLAPIYFDVMSAELDTKATARVKSLKSRVSAAGSVLLIGHSGTLNGNSPENIAISRARAASTLTALKSIGAKGPFAVSGVGALDPASTGKTQAAQAKNRRVVIVLIP
jgi:alpha-tubulin suppressor-like RCC1 family protein/outer membrane protein OmpA-like peptidoglycan-associated protein